MEIIKELHACMHIYMYINLCVHSKFELILLEASELIGGWSQNALTGAHLSAGLEAQVQDTSKDLYWF